MLLQLQNLLNWWMGDALGIMLVTPLILVWRWMPNGWLEPKRMTEAVLVLGLTLLGGQIVFLSWFHDTVGHVALGYWMFLFVTWAAARLGIHGVVTILFMTAIQGLLGAVQGVGIIPNQIKRLFQVFQRLQSRADYEGAGIGLALCRKIAEHHKGRIWAESAGEGRGSKFCVVLPVPL